MTIEVPYKVGDQIWAVSLSGYSANARIKCPNCQGQGRIPISAAPLSFLKCKRCDGEKTLDIEGDHKYTVDFGIIRRIDIEVAESGIKIEYCVGMRHMMMHREITRIVFDTQSAAALHRN